MKPKNEWHFKPITYEVTVCDAAYRYALHSDRKHKIIFPSQILNILEYVLFRKVKDGFKADGGLITEENFPFKISRMNDGKPDEREWAEYPEVEKALRALLQDYYEGLLQNGSKAEESVAVKEEAEEEEAPANGGEVWAP